MSQDIPSLESFAVTLEKVKLPKTALVFREELEKNSNFKRLEKGLSSNPLVETFMTKLESREKQNYMGIGDWGLGIGDWGLGNGPNPQSPIPNPQIF